MENQSNRLHIKLVKADNPKTMYKDEKQPLKVLKLSITLTVLLLNFKL